MDYPGTPPPSVYQVTHGTALQAAERNVRHLSCEEGTHRSEVIVRSLRWRLILYCLRQLFCFVAFLSACGQTRRMWRVRQGSSLTWLSIRIRLQRRKPGENNKHFDLIVLPQDTIRPIRKIRGGDIYTHPLAYGVAHHKKNHNTFHDAWNACGLLDYDAFCGRSL